MWHVSEKGPETPLHCVTYIESVEQTPLLAAHGGGVVRALAAVVPPLQQTLVLVLEVSIATSINSGRDIQVHRQVYVCFAPLSTSFWTDRRYP